MTDEARTELALAHFAPAANGPALDFEADDLEQGDGSAAFELVIGQLVHIVGTIHIEGRHVFIDDLVKPAKLSVDKAHSFVVEAILRGQDLDIRPAFARRIRRALQD